MFWLRGAWFNYYVNHIKDCFTCYFKALLLVYCYHAALIITWVHFQTQKSVAGIAVLNGFYSIAVSDYM